MMKDTKLFASMDDQHEDQSPNVVNAEWLLQCPLSFERMEDPVVLFPSGQSYDRKSICQALLCFPNLDPRTGVYYDTPLRHATNFALRNVLQDMNALVPYNDSHFAYAYAMAWEEKVGNGHYTFGEGRRRFRRRGIVENMIEAPQRLYHFLLHLAWRLFGDERVVDCVLVLLLLAMTASICYAVFSATAKERMAFSATAKERMAVSATAKEPIAFELMASCSKYHTLSPAIAWYSCRRT